MTIESDFIPFANSLANVQDLTDYDASAPGGNVPGIADSAYVNRALRQGTTMSAALAMLLLEITQTNIVDTYNNSDTVIPPQLLAQTIAALAPLPPILTQFKTGASSGTYAPDVYWFVATPSTNPTIGATYTDGASVTYTVVSTTTIFGQTVVQATPTSGFAAPSRFGTLTKASGTGDATLTLYALRLAVYIQHFVMGGGGGGGGCATAASSSGVGGPGGGGGAFLGMIKNPVYTGYAWAVGDGGVGGAAGNHGGASGGNSSFNSWTASGGTGGSGGAAITSFPSATLGGQGSTADATNGNKQFLGGDGGVSICLSAAVNIIGNVGGSAQGAPCFGGSGTAGGSTNAANTGIGGGAGAQTNNGGNQSGGKGGIGIIQIYAYFQ